MDWEEELTSEQVLKIKDIKNPTITEIIEISEMLEVDPLTIFNFFKKNDKSSREQFKSLFDKK